MTLHYTKLFGKSFTKNISSARGTSPSTKMEEKSKKFSTQNRTSHPTTKTPFPTPDFQHYERKNQKKMKQKRKSCVIGYEQQIMVKKNKLRKF